MSTKKIIKIVAIFSLLIVATLALAMFIAGRNIGSIIEKQINKNITTSCTIEKAEVSVFRNWPFVYSSLHNLEIMGSHGIDEKALLQILDVELQLGFWNALRFGLGNSEVLTIRKMDFNEASINLFIDSLGTENWDIVKESDDEAVFSFKLQKYTALNSSVDYKDDELGLAAQLRNVHHHGSGQLGTDIYTILTDSKADSFSIEYQGLSLLKDAELDLNMPIRINWSNSRFSIDSSQIKLNNFDFYAVGDIDFPDEYTGLYLNFGHEEFEDLYGLLSVIPIFNEQYASVKAKGDFKFRGKINGIYSSTSMPLYSFNLELGNGNIELESLGTSLDKLSAKVNLINRDSLKPKVDLRISDLAFSSGGDPFLANLSVSDITAASRYSIDAKGSLNLTYWSELLGLESPVKLDGTVSGGLISNGAVSDLQGGNYHEIKMQGKVNTDALEISGEGTPAVQINALDAEFDNLEFELLEFKAQSGKSDISGYGNALEPLRYLMEEDAVLKSTLFLKSDTFNVNDFYSFSGESSADSRAIALPENMDIELFLKAKKVFYDNLEIDYLNGEVVLSDSKLFMDNINFGSCGGKLSLNGSYSGPIDSLEAIFDFDFSVIDVNIAQASRLFKSSAALAPILEYLNGRLSSTLRFEGNIDGKMFPVLESLNGGGLVNIPNAEVLGFEPLLAISNYLKISDLKKLDVAGMKLSFELENGRMIVYPFKLNFKDISFTIEGWHALDGSMDYNLGMRLPRYYLETNMDLISRLEGQASKRGLETNGLDTLFLDLQLNGTMKRPKVTANLDEAAQSAYQRWKKTGVEKAEEEREKLRKRSQQIADSIINENRRKLDSIKLAQKKRLDSIKIANQQKLDSIRKAKEEEAKEALRKKLEELLKKGK